MPTWQVVPSSLRRCVVACQHNDVFLSSVLYDSNDHELAYLQSLVIPGVRLPRFNPASSLHRRARLYISTVLFDKRQATSQHADA
jgi:hypothetical protein